MFLRYICESFGNIHQPIYNLRNLFCEQHIKLRICKIQNSTFKFHIANIKLNSHRAH